MFRVQGLCIGQTNIPRIFQNSNGQTSIGVSGLDCMPRVQGVLGFGVQGCLGFRVVQGLGFMHWTNKHRADFFKNSNGQTSTGVSGLDCMPRVWGFLGFRDQGFMGLGFRGFRVFRVFRVFDVQGLGLFRVQGCLGLFRVQGCLGVFRVVQGCLGFRGFRVYALDKQAQGGFLFNNNGQTSRGVSGLDCMPRVQGVGCRVWVQGLGLGVQVLGFAF